MIDGVKFVIAILVGWADLCHWFPAVSDQQSLALTDCEQISSQPVLEFTAAHFLHVATSIVIVATRGKGRNYKLSRIPGSKRPPRVPAHVYTMRSTTLIV